MGNAQYDVDRAAIESNQSYDEASGMLNRDLERRGINPNSGRFAGVKARMALRRAAGEAGAKTRAYNQAQDKSYNRLMELIRMGRNGVQQGAMAPQPSYQMFRGGTVGRSTRGADEGGGGFAEQVNARVAALGGKPMAALAPAGEGIKTFAGGNPNVKRMEPLAKPRQRIGAGGYTPIEPVVKPAAVQPPAPQAPAVPVDQGMEIGKVDIFDDLR
jgi:hypothetical protein